VTSPGPQTLLCPRDSTATPGAGLWASLRSGGLPPDLLEESVRRLRVLALLFSFTFFMAGPFPALICGPCRTFMFSSFRYFGPGVLSIGMGLLVFALARSPRVPATSKLWLGLGFEVLGSIGIAAAEYQSISSGIKPVPVAGMEEMTMVSAGFGLSWVSVWVLLFTIVVPTPPGRALLAAALSASAVPLIFARNMVKGYIVVQLSALQFFFALVFPYILVVFMAYVAARIVFRLGAAVTRARELGSYRLVERLGSGGMGEVWRAEHRLLARPAAVKLIRPETLGDGSPAQRRVALQRFEREAQATAIMRCPHTVELYDFGVAEDGTFYYVMELLDGFGLDTLVNQFGPLPAARAIHFLHQVCHSLGEAHEHGLIHRDIKPANVYVCRLGRDVDCIKVLDFGMVKTRPQEATADLKLTADNVVGGTPAFMSPEQVLGDRPVDARTDLYAVGCLAYWLLTGRLVFEGRTPMETMVQHAQAAPIPPSRRSELPIPPALEAAVLACLEKDPPARPQSADELAHRLAAAGADLAWTAAQAHQWWAAHRPRGALHGGSLPPLHHPLPT